MPESGGVRGVVAKTGRGIVVVVVVVVTVAATLVQIFFLPELTQVYLTPLTVLVALIFAQDADALTVSIKGANGRSVNESVRAIFLVILNTVNDSQKIINCQF